MLFSENKDLDDFTLMICLCTYVRERHYQANLSTMYIKNITNVTTLFLSLWAAISSDQTNSLLHPTRGVWCAEAVLVLCGTLA